MSFISSPPDGSSPNLGGGATGIPTIEAVFQGLPNYLIGGPASPSSFSIEYSTFQQVSNKLITYHNRADSAVTTFTTTTFTNGFAVVGENGLEVNTGTSMIATIGGSYLFYGDITNNIIRVFNITKNVSPAELTTTGNSAISGLPSSGAINWTGSGNWSIPAIAAPNAIKSQFLTISNNSLSNNAVIEIDASATLVIANKGIQWIILAQGQYVKLWWNSSAWVVVETNSAPTDISRLPGGHLGDYLIKGVSRTTVTTATGTSWHFLLSVDRVTRINELRVAVTTAVAGATGKIQIYRDTSSVAGRSVGEILVDCNFSLAAVATVSATMVSTATLAPGYYWVQIAYSAAGGVLRAWNNAGGNLNVQNFGVLGTTNVNSLSTTEAFTLSPQPNRLVGTANTLINLPIMLVK